MTPRHILAALLIEGKTSTSIARKMGIAPQTISNVIHRHRKSRRVQEEISRILKKPYAEVWGGKDAA